MSFDLQIEGLEECVREWDTLVIPRLQRGCTESVEIAIVEGALVARQLAPVRTGELQQGIQATLVSSGVTESSALKSVTGQLKSNAPYSSFVEDDTAPHTIAGRAGGFLAWEGDGGQGDWHFARSVNHPGTKGHPFMGPAYLEMERVVARELDRAADDAARMFNK